MGLHKLLLRQLKGYNNNQVLEDEEFKRFIQSINQSYVDFDEDKALLENINDENQKELNSLNDKLQKIAKSQEFVINEQNQNILDAYAKLSKSEYEFQTILENIAEIIILANSDCKITYVSPNIETLLGYKPENLLGKEISNLFPLSKLKEQKEMVCQIPNMEAKQGIINMDLIDLLNVEVPFGIFYKNEIENPLFNAIIFTLRNSEEVKLKEREIERQKDFYEHILQGIPADIAIFDKDHRYVFLNKKAINNDELRNYIIGKNDIEYATYRGTGIKRAEDRQKLFKLVKEDKKTHSFEEDLIDGEGNKRTILRNFHPVFDDNNVLSYVVGFGLDITLRKEAEEEIKNLNSTLEDRVKERTLQLEMANKELDSFSYSVSHDLRSPLRAVDGWSQALLEDYGGFLDQTAHEYIGRIIRESTRMSSLIDNLLSLSKISKVKLQIKSIDLAAFSKEVFERLTEQQVPRKKIMFTVEDNLVVEADPCMLDIVMTNLLSNSIKFTQKKDEPEIIIGKSINDGIQVIYIKDNGAGFNLIASSKLFGAFQRMHKQSDFPGTGVGLATVQKIISTHGGQIWAESKKDAGATFYFYLTSVQKK